MNRMWPREVIAEIRLMPWRAPVAATIGVSPRLPHRVVIGTYVSRAGLRAS
jgi:hypothetical protein